MTKREYKYHRNKKSTRFWKPVALAVFELAMSIAKEVNRKKEKLTLSKLLE